MAKRKGYATPEQQAQANKRYYQSEDAVLKRKVRNCKSNGKSFIYSRTVQYSKIFSKLNIAGWSSLEARRAHNPKVIGSNPVPAIFCPDSSVGRARD
nr:MAG TPA: hypothetical protein [Caudoviricetes sp.]